MQNLHDLFVFAVQNGLSQNTLLLLLLLPAVATLVVFFRVLVGLEYLNINRAIFLSLGVASLGLAQGLFFFIATVGLDLLFHALLERKRLLPPAKYGFSLLAMMLILLILFTLAAYIKADITRTILSLNIVSVLLIVISSHAMFQSSPGDPALRPLAWILQMIIFLAGSFFILTSPVVQAFAFDSPLVFLAMIIVLMIVLGRFKGLRLIEYVRFASVMLKKES